MIEEISYAEKITVRIAMKKEVADKVDKMLQDLTSGQLILDNIEKSLFRTKI